MRKRTTETTAEMKTGRIAEACARYNLGKNTMRKVAKDAGAIIKIGTCVLINFTIVDAYLDALAS